MSALEATAAVDIDPITFEVVRHKLQAITEEQAITLKSISGSPVVTDATDFNNGLYLADGSIVTMGPQVIFHTGTMSTVIRHIIERYEKNPGIRSTIPIAAPSISLMCRSLPPFSPAAAASPGRAPAPISSTPAA
jgi:Hydantoinase B/oxoprolinase